VDHQVLESGGHGSQSFTETMQNSCNPFYAKLGIDLGGERFYKGLTDFNLGYKMGVDFQVKHQALYVLHQTVFP